MRWCKFNHNSTTWHYSNNTIFPKACNLFLQIFQDPTAMMQQLLNTTRQLTLGAYKHETECECLTYLHSSYYVKKLWLRQHKYWSYSRSNHVNHTFSCRAGVTHTRKSGSGEEEDKPGDRRAEGATESLQRKHQFPEGRDTQTGGGGPDEGSLRTSATSDGTSVRSSAWFFFCGTEQFTFLVLILTVSYLLFSFIVQIKTVNVWQHMTAFSTFVLLTVFLYE